MAGKTDSNSPKSIDDLFQQNNQEDAILKYLHSIDKSLSDMLSKGVPNTNKSGKSDSKSSNTYYKDKYDKDRDFKSDVKKAPKGFAEGIRKAVLDSIGVSDIKDQLGKSMTQLADLLGGQVSDIPGILGKELGGQLIGKLKTTKLGKDAYGKLDSISSQFTSQIQKSNQAFAEAFEKATGQSAKDIIDRNKAMAKARAKSGEYAEDDSNTDSSNGQSKEYKNTSSENKKDQSLSSLQISELNVQAEKVQVTYTANKAKQSQSEARDQDKPEDDIDNSDLDKNRSLSDAQDINDNSSDSRTNDSQSSLGSVNRDSSDNAGMDVSDIAKDALSDIVGDNLFDILGDQAKEALSGKLGGILGKLGGKGGQIGNLASKALSFLSSSGSTTAAAATTTTTAAAATTTAATATTATTATVATGALSGLASAAVAAASAIWPVIAALAILEAVSEAVSPAIEGFTKLWGAAKAAYNREATERKKRQENEQARLEADIETMVRAPFKILEDAANELYQAWDNNIRVINGTQGYNKDELQDLIGSYAQRLRDEDLSSVVSSADITDSLGSVLKSGLSGPIAEEFAYQASILNAAIPTQDFFNYASTYASIAAQAQAQGKSQSDAIQYANSQLYSFANNILYASRNLTGGFTTGLQNASDLFDAAVKISQTSRTGNPAEIGGVLTAVSAITGALAPDLASSMTDAIVQAATGGNSSQLVALRSLAGINASNTEFLRAIAENPQKVFTDLFEGLATMQNMSNDNYMEVAESLSNVFGISMDAFARLDFNQLASAIQNMDIASSSLEDNIKHLASGETTTSAEQLRMQQINQYMIDEGLSYVLDNEVARTIQEHMWEEQIANELMENTFAVELKGAALEFLEGIRQTIDNIIGLLNPFSWINKGVDLVSTAAEAELMDVDMKTFLEQGKVGSGNAQSFYQLTTRGVDLNVTPDIISMMGGMSLQNAVRGGRDIYRYMTNGWGQLLWDSEKYSGQVSSILHNVLHPTSSHFNNSPNAYSWGTIGKSAASTFYDVGVPSGSSYSSASMSMQSPAEDSVNTAAINAALDKLTDADYVNQFISENKSYEDWVKTAKDFGISDLYTALEAVGRTESDLQMFYQQSQTKAGAEQERLRMETEENFWSNTQANQITQHELTTSGNELLENILNNVSEFKTLFDNYFIKHTYYDQSGYNYNKVEEIKRKEASGEQDAIYALASALTQNNVDLRDPAVQTNAILAQILIVLQAIMQQNNTTGKLTIPDSIAGMASGMFKYQ